MKANVMLSGFYLIYFIEITNMEKYIELLLSFIFNHRDVRPVITEYETYVCDNYAVLIGNMYLLIALRRYTLRVL